MVASLANSGLGITENMTFDEISAKLADRFPGVWYSYNKGTFRDAYTATTNRGASFTKNASNMLLSAPQNGTGYYVVVESDDIDFTNYNKLVICHNESLAANNKCAVGYGTKTYSAEQYNNGSWNEAVFFGGTGTHFSAQTASTHTTTFDISGVSGNRKVGLFCSAGLNGGTAAMYVTLIYLTK